MSKQKKSYAAPVFIVFVVAFASWTYLSQIKGKAEKKEKQENELALLPFSNSTVTAIELKPVGLPEVKLSKVDQVWRVDTPYRDLADTSAVESFLSTLSTEKVRETVTESAGGDLVRFGLEKPLASVHVIAGDKSRRIEIGQVKAFDGSSYARIDGSNRIVTLSEGMQTTLGRDPRDFREKRFFLRKTPPEFSEVSIVKGRVAFTLIKTEKGWVQKGVGQATWPLDSALIEQYIKSIVSLRGTDVLDEDKLNKKVKAKFKLEAPGFSVKLSEAPKAEAPAVVYELQIGQHAPDSQQVAAVGSDRPLVFSLTKSQAASVSKMLDDLRDFKFPFQVKISEVSRIAIVRSKGLAAVPAVIKADGKWVIAKPEKDFKDRIVKSEMVDQFLSQIVGFKAEQALPLGDASPKVSEKDSLHVEFFDSQDKKLLELTFALHNLALHVSSSAVAGRVFKLDDTEKKKYEELMLDWLAAK